MNAHPHNGQGSWPGAGWRSGAEGASDRHVLTFAGADSRVSCRPGSGSGEPVFTAWGVPNVERRARLRSSEMNRFVSTFTNRIDAKGRVSIPAAFRGVLERDGYSQGDAGGIYCYPSLDAPALDAGGERLAQKIDRLLAGLPDYSDERDELSVALYGDVHVLGIDGDGRIVVPEQLRAHAGLSAHVTFVGLGDKFQMWQPERFAERRELARQKVHEHRRLFGAAQPATRSSDDDGGATE